MHPFIILMLLILEKRLLGQPFFEWRVYVAAHAADQLFADLLDHFWAVPADGTNQTAGILDRVIISFKQLAAGLAPRVQWHRRGMNLRDTRGKPRR